MGVAKQRMLCTMNNNLVWETVVESVVIVGVLQLTILFESYMHVHLGNPVPTSLLCGSLHYMYIALHVNVYVCSI